MRKDKQRLTWRQELHQIIFQDFGITLSTPLVHNARGFGGGLKRPALKHFGYTGTLKQASHKLVRTEI